MTTRVRARIEPGRGHCGIGPLRLRRRLERFALRLQLERAALHVTDQIGVRFTTVGQPHRHVEIGGSLDVTGLEQSLFLLPEGTQCLRRFTCLRRRADQDKTADRVGVTHREMECDQASERIPDDNRRDGAEFDLQLVHEIGVRERSARQLRLTEPREIGGDDAITRGVESARDLGPHPPVGDAGVQQQHGRPVATDIVRERAQIRGSSVAMGRTVPAR